MPPSESPTSVKCSLKTAEGTLKMLRSYRETKKCSGLTEKALMEPCQEEAGVSGREGTNHGQGPERSEDAMRLALKMTEEAVSGSVARSETLEEVA